ncbi:hypothetical protein PTNB73_04966 [Pyrenophora teres f. teres]|nr:hypothetical protein PTNB73_04966 [Pyrenophora teres f. teres]
MAITNTTSAVQAIFSLHVITAGSALLLSLAAIFVLLRQLSGGPGQPRTFRKFTRSTDIKHSSLATHLFLLLGLSTLFIAYATQSSIVALQSRLSSPFSITSAYAYPQYTAPYGFNPSIHYAKILSILSFTYQCATILLNTAIVGAIWITANYLQNNGTGIREPGKVSWVLNGAWMAAILGLGFASWGLGLVKRGSGDAAVVYGDLVQGDHMVRTLYVVYMAVVIAASTSVTIEAVLCWIGVRKNGFAGTRFKSALTRFVMLVAPLVWIRNAFSIAQLIIIYRDVNAWSRTTNQALAFLFIIFGELCDLGILALVLRGAWSFGRKEEQMPVPAKEERYSESSMGDDYGGRASTNPLRHMSMPKFTDIPSFAASQLTLLDAELQAELSETNALLSSHNPTSLARAGLAILNLNVSSIRTGLGGKTVVELGLDSAVVAKGEKADIPEHGIRVGDIVAVQDQPSGSAKKAEKKELEKKGAAGVVLKVRRENVEIVLDKEDADVPTGGKLWIVKLANDVTYKRMNQTMSRLQKLGDQDYTPFMRVLFGQASPTPLPSDVNDPSNPLYKLEWIDASLNDSQQEAIRFALASREVALIHGPPGTGKTHTLIELILQLLKQKLRLLVCGPSNISVDNIVERLASHKVPMVRLGHPARLLPSVLSHSLDVLTRTSEAAALVQDVRKEMDDKQSSIRKTRNAKERRQIYTELKELRQEFREREKGCVNNLVSGSKVVLATLHGAGGFHLKGQEFDVVIVDEASQALEAQCWVPLLWVKASKLVLAGDHLQLPPTIKSLNSKESKAAKKDAKKSKDETDEAEKSTSSMTLETTLFDRLLALHGPSIKRMLTTQYRMHERIMRFPSDELYDSNLIAADLVKERLLKDLPYEVEDTEDSREPLVFWDTQGGEFPEKIEDSGVIGKGGKGMNVGDSKSNEAEAALVKMHVSNLISAGVKAEDIAVVTPYNAQLALLGGMLKEAYPGIELGSVDGFQGREKEAVIVSTVRSNSKHEVGFLGEKRRLNVAMTRPKRHLCVIGDSETISK